MSTFTTFIYSFGSGPVPAHYHPNGGGVVADTAHVSPDSYVGPDAMVFEKARVYDGAWVFDNAKVSGNAQVSGGALIFGEAEVFGECEIYGGAQVYDCAGVWGTAEVYGGAEIGGKQKVFDGVWVGQQAANSQPEETSGSEPVRLKATDSYNEIERRLTTMTQFAMRPFMYKHLPEYMHETGEQYWGEAADIRAEALMAADAGESTEELKEEFDRMLAMQQRDLEILRERQGKGAVETYMTAKDWELVGQPGEQDEGDSVDMVNHPPHYTNHPSGTECIEITEFMTFNQGNAVKYLWRMNDKGDPIENLEKARFYIEREISRLQRWT